MLKLVQKVFGSHNDRVLKKIFPLVDRINQLEADYASCSDEALRSRTGDYRQRIENGEPLDDLLPEAFAMLDAGETYRIQIVNRSVVVPVRSLLTAEGLEWFVLHMVENFAHFEPLGLVLVMLMGVAIAEGSGLIPTIMRGIAINVPRRLITPAVFALAACGNVGSDAGIVVIPPLAAAMPRRRRSASFPTAANLPTSMT